jgi:hypothetical protein
MMFIAEATGGWGIAEIGPAAVFLLLGFNMLLNAWMRRKDPHPKPASNPHPVRGGDVDARYWDLRFDTIMGTLKDISQKLDRVIEHKDRES